MDLREDALPLPKVVVVEDDDAMRELLVSALEADGHEIEFATNGDDALKLIESRAGVPLLLLTDVRMPGADGLELLRRVRRLDASVPVLLLTAFVDDELLAQAVEAGATAVFSKPADLDDVRTAVLIFASTAASARRARREDGRS